MGGLKEFKHHKTFHVVSMDDHLIICQCLVDEEENSGPGEGCMGQRVTTIKGRRRRQVIDLPSIWDGKTEERENLWQNSCGEGINNRRPNTTMEATGRAQKRTIEPWVKPVATASDRTDTLGEESSEYGSCVSGWSSLQSASVASTTDWLGSIDSINSPESQSLSVETFPLGGGLSPEISERRLKKLGVVERTLLESWRGLPWQARLCPRAIQIQEDYRRACAFRKEKYRVNAWRQKQKATALEAARSEEERLAALWKRDAIKLWEHEAKLWKAHVQLAERHESHIATLEQKRAELISVGYGQELAALDRMDSSRHAERLKQIDSLLNIFSAEVRMVLVPDTPFPGDTMGEAVNLNTPRVEEESPRSIRAEAAYITQVSAERDAELERGSRYIAAVTAAARVSIRRENFAHLIFRGLAAMYHEARIRATWKFATECAAELARAKLLGSNSHYSISEENDEIDHIAGWEGERHRALAEIEKEASFTTRWSRLQRAVFRKSTGEILRLLTINSLRQAPGNGGERGVGATESIGRVRTRARRTLAELRVRQAEAETDAKGVRRSCMEALEEWKIRLERLRAAVIEREANELRVVHKEKEEALAARERTVTYGLGKRRQIVTQSWGRVAKLEHDCVSDASTAWRRCFVITWEKLKEFFKNTCYDHDRMEKYWQDKWALEVEISRVLAETIGEEKQRLEHQQSLFAVTLEDIVTDATVAEADAIASARCLWWKEAREELLKLFPTVVDTLSYEGDTPLEEVLGADAVDRARVSNTILLRLDDVTREDDKRSVAAMATIATENGPLRSAVEEHDQRYKETINRCHSAVNAVVEHRSCPSKNFLEAMSTFGPGADDSALLHLDVHEDLQRVQPLLEKEAVERASASLEGETKKLAMEANEQSCPSCSDTPSELTKSQLDLRRVARVREGSKALGNMLFQAHDVILEAKRDAMEANNEDFTRKVSLSTSRHLRTIDRIQDDARDDCRHALRAAVKDADKRTHIILGASSVAREKRCRSIQLTGEWLDELVSSERDKSAQRLRQRKEQNAAWTASLTALNRSLSRQQQECAVRVRQGGKDALEAARDVVAQQVDETIRQKREKGPDIEMPSGHNEVASPGDDIKALTTSSTSETQDNELPALGIQSDETDQNTREGSPRAAETTSDIVTRNIEGDETSPSRDTPFPPSDEINNLEASAILAAAEASLLVTIKSWASSAQSQARAWSEKLLSDAIFQEAEVKRTVELDSEALTSGFHAAQEAVKQVFSNSVAEKDLRDLATGKETEMADAKGEHHTTDTNEYLGSFLAAESQECNRLWSSLEERALLAWLPDVMQHRAQKAERFREEAQEFGEGAAAYVEDLKSGLRDIFEKTTTNARGELERTVITSREKLELAILSIKEEHASARKEKERAAAEAEESALSTMVDASAGEIGNEIETADADVAAAVDTVV